ncbi:MAG: DUF1446 domain-containing protein [Ectothiorhodospiraceae bacterium]|nr:DUF1446 domain-containing protein [Ectothiorhodospiraceae bacterium]
MSGDTVYIGCGAGFAGDRFDAAGPVVRTLARRDGPRYLIFEVLAERTLAIAQRLRREDPEAGYSPFLDDYVRPVLADCVANRIRIVSNFGAANPLGAARRIQAIAAELGIENLKVGVVEGDDLLGIMSADEVRALPTVEGLPLAGVDLVAANAYLGARPVAAALALGADVVAVGRCTDVALTLGPLIHEFGWAEDDWDRLAAGTVAGHLLECGAQVTGSYFADPGYKDVPALARVGFPIGEIGRDGSVVITKAEDTGGMVSERTVKEQILYEVHDPSAYLTPDVVLDLTGVEVRQVGPDRVAVIGAAGHPRPPTLKATVSLDGGWLGEAEMSYAGPNALARAELAVEVLRERFATLGVNSPVRYDIIGVMSTFDGDGAPLRKAAAPSPDGDYRVRVAVRSLDRKVAERVTNEVLALYCCGPAGGGGQRQSITSQIQTASVLVDRDRVRPRVALA